LKALTTFAPDALPAISWAAEPASNVIGLNVEKSMGLVMSTMTLPSSCPSYVSRTSPTAA
jgi:hypothetical protein